MSVIVSWCHMLLLAYINDSRDNRNNITDNWVRILENVHSIVLPFTLWPLEYRTSVVMASSALVTPRITSINLNDGGKVAIKFYISNDLLLVCIQETAESENSCDEMCIFNKPCEENHGVHSMENEKQLVKCKHRIVYSQIKKSIHSKVRECMSETTIKHIVCTGFGDQAVLSNMLSYDLSVDFNRQSKFLKKDPIQVDCVTFGMKDSFNKKYIDCMKQSVNSTIDIVFKNGEYVTYTNNTLPVMGCETSTCLSYIEYIKSITQIS